MKIKTSMFQKIDENLSLSTNRWPHLRPNARKLSLSTTCTSTKIDENLKLACSKNMHNKNISKNRWHVFIARYYLNINQFNLY